MENQKPKKVFALKEKLNKKIKLIVLDEGSMVNKEIGEDLLSFQIPVIVLGDLNQLPPVFGNPIFFKKSNDRFEENYETSRKRSDYLVIATSLGKKTITSWCLWKICGL